METLLDAVHACLVQGRELLMSLDDRQYTLPCAACFNSTIGSHIRHNLDHFVSFGAGLDSGRVDYESRQRDERMATDKAYALEAIDRCMRIVQECEGLEMSTPLLVREESDGNAGGSVWLTSSLGRELQFLLGHTVHHNALIATIAHGMDIDLPPGFGVAPSTQRFKGVVKKS